MKKKRETRERERGGWRQRSGRERRDRGREIEEERGLKEQQEQ